jgi:error-prone DNA polymerase
MSDDTVRLGFCVVNGMREERVRELVREREERSFSSTDDFKRRVPLGQDELRNLAELGALSCFAEHRRAAMWEVEEVLHDDLLGSARSHRAAFGIVPKALKHRRLEAGSSTQDAGAPRQNAPTPGYRDSPLIPMTIAERVQSDYETMNLTTGPHPMKLLREGLPNVWRASELAQVRHGATIQIAGNVICRQRPGTAKGFVFISLEDETGVSNAIVHPDLFEKVRLIITEEAFLLIEGEAQNSEGVVLIKARKLAPLVHEKLLGSASHDFH